MKRDKQEKSLKRRTDEELHRYKVIHRIGIYDTNQVKIQKEWSMKHKENKLERRKGNGEITCILPG